MPPPRIAVGLFSPITQRSASSRLDLPQPFGPTTPVRPSAMIRSVGSTKLLNPLRRSLVKRTRKRPAMIPLEGKSATGGAEESTRRPQICGFSVGYPQDMAGLGGQTLPNRHKPAPFQRRRLSESALTPKAPAGDKGGAWFPAMGAKRLGMKWECGEGRSRQEAQVRSRPRDCMRRADANEATGQPGRQASREDPQARRPALRAKPKSPSGVTGQETR